MTTVGALVGVDLGQSSTKVVVVDTTGRQLARSVDAAPVSRPRPFWAERDLESMWSGTAAAVRAALEEAGPGVEVLAVGLSGHSDGLYLVDAEGRPTRPAILATDARAWPESARLSAGSPGERLLELTGQLPMAASPVALLSWLRTHEPQALEASRWLLSSTDWLRLGLTGVVATDRTMAAASWVELRGSTWSPRALALCGLEHLLPRLPPVLQSEAVVGTVTPEAGRCTGLRPGTPVVAGAHDVACGALALGATATGAVSVLLGTYSINQVLLDDTVRDRRWQVRPFLDDGRWLHMSTSPAGAGCLDWAAGATGVVDASGRPDVAAAVSEAERATAAPGLPLFLPYVHGGPRGAGDGGAWSGLRSEHDRPALLRAVLEGVAFSHRRHLETLASRLPLTTPIRLGGGGTRSRVWSQLLCDTFGLPVEVTASYDVSVLGAAVLAGVAAGVFGSLDEGAQAVVRVDRVLEPDDARHDLLGERFARYAQMSEDD